MHEEWHSRALVQFCMLCVLDVQMLLIGWEVGRNGEERPGFQRRSRGKGGGKDNLDYGYASVETCCRLQLAEVIGSQLNGDRLVNAPKCALWALRCLRLVHIAAAVLR